MSREPSRALPAPYYGDPARHVRFEIEICTGCKHEVRQAHSGAKWCKLKNKYGTRCQFFESKKGQECRK